jgi:hypothetical protein
MIQKVKRCQRVFLGMSFQQRQNLHTTRKQKTQQNQPAKCEAKPQKTFAEILSETIAQRSGKY